jgi:hypothetical protein
VLAGKIILCSDQKFNELLGTTSLVKTLSMSIHRLRLNHCATGVEDQHARGVFIVSGVKMVSVV